MSAAALLTRKLDAAGIAFHQANSRRGNAITVAATQPNGFPVLLLDGDGGSIVGFAGWHEDIPAPEDAARCAWMGIVGLARLKVYSRGSFDYRWAAEFRSDGQWVVDSEVGLFLFPFWRRLRICYLQNQRLAK